MSGTVLVLGLGLTGRAVAEALIRRGEEVRPVDDRPEGAVRAAVSELGLDLVVAPGAEDWPGLLDGCDRVVVSPGVHDALRAPCRPGRVGPGRRLGCTSPLCGDRH